MKDRITEAKERYITKPLRQASLCLLIKDDEAILAMKRRGFGAGLWNGLGGKPETTDASIEETAIREAQQEADVTPKSLRKVAIINFYFTGKPEWDQQVVVFITNEWDGTPKETEEMSPKSFKLDEIPYSDMWEADALWLPKILEGKRVEADILFGNNQKLIESEIREVEFFNS
jgi:8-oxo-dGTP pyrophosphatase MutT (NUDIX family)